LPKNIDTLKHQTIKKLTEDIDEFRFNTGVSQLMIFVNALSDIDGIDKSTYQDLILLIAPFAPHLAEEIWEEL
jgi:leucyl-tRNA synthetase